MPLSKDDRIAFSKKIVETPLLITSINKSKESIQKEKEKAQKLDQAHKNLVDSKTTLIDAYQGELLKLDGVTRSNLTEIDQVNAANMVQGNFFYPNDPANPPPGTAPALWTKTKPYGKNKAIGKFYNEAYGTTVTKESDLVSPIQSDISSVQSTFDLMERVTGQKCITVGGCSLPAYTTQPTCLLNGGTWTTPVDSIVTYPEMHAALENLKTKVNAFRSYLIVEAATIYLLDSNTTRKNESQAALDNINNVIVPAIDAWLATPDFNTAHTATTCVAFHSYNASLLAPTKMSTTTVNTLLSAFISRDAFVSSRKAQIEGYLGTVNQDLGTGDVTGAGLYFERWGFVQLRLNILGGSLFSLKGFDRAQSAQDEQISNANTAKSTYESTLKCSAFSAPATGTHFLSLKSSTGFAVGDTVFVIAEDQPELVRTIESIDGNRLKLTETVPANYKDSAFGRVYKDLS